MERSKILLKVIQNLSQKMREIKEREFQKTSYQDLSAASIQYIDVISTMHNPTSVELAAKLGLSKPTIAVMVGKLAENGYIQKQRSHEDGRAFFILLTEKGKKIAKAYHEAQTEVVKHISSRLNREEIDSLIALLAKIS